MTTPHRRSLLPLAIVLALVTAVALLGMARALDPAPIAPPATEAAMPEPVIVYRDRMVTPVPTPHPTRAPTRTPGPYQTPTPTATGTPPFGDRSTYARSETQ